MDFDNQTIQKIAQAVNGYLKSYKNPAAILPRVASYNDGSFWAEIQERDPDADGFKYSWKAVRFNSDGTYEADDTIGKGLYSDESGYAIEHRWLSQHVVERDLVHLTPCQGNLYYTFDYLPEIKVGRGNCTARDGQVPGQGSMTYQVYDKETDEFADADPHIAISFKNWSKTEVPSSRYVSIFFAQGFWWLNGFDCRSI